MKRVNHMHIYTCKVIKAFSNNVSTTLIACCKFLEASLSRIKCIAWKMKILRLINDLIFILFGNFEKSLV